MDRVEAVAFLPEGARDDITLQIGFIWGQIKAPLIVPLLKLAVIICLAMSLMLFIERVYMGIVIVLVKLLGKKPEKRYKWEPMKDDVELGNSAYPMVLVQIPMYNEREVIFSLFTSLCRIPLFSSVSDLSSDFLQVYQLSIGAACGLSWPSDRIVIQVLDDSTDPTIKVLTLSTTKPIPFHIYFTSSTI